MTAPDAGTPDTADELTQFAEASKSPEDFWLVYRTLMARYDSSCRVAHMTAFADEVAALAVSALAATGRLLPPDAETRTEWGTRLAWDDGPVEDLESSNLAAAQGRVGMHARQRAERPGWRATAALIQRTHWVGPWLPAPTTDTDTEDTP